MSVFAWRRRSTRHFGEQWVPFAEIHLRSTSGRWRAFSVQVDSGAIISVVSRSAADLLGIVAEQGDAIDLSGISAPPQRYYVHRLIARIGDLHEFEMRIAVADREDVPNLLGRLDILDRMQIDFDASLEETRLSMPWLDAGDRSIWRACLDVQGRILQAWSNHTLPGCADEAARRFVNRADQLVAAGAGLLKLHRAFELPLVLRSLFELSVQFEYMMRDPEPRAVLYLDYQHITRYRSEQAWLGQPGPVGDHLRASSRRAAGEKKNRAQYDSVLNRYAVRQGSTRPRSHWYAGTLKDIANDLGRTAEYDAVFGVYSAWAHGDPWTADLLQIGHGGLWHALAYWAQILIQVADAKKIVLAGEHYELLVELKKGMTA